MSVPNALVILVTSFAVSGCTLLYDGKYDHDEGWRLGTIGEIGNGDSIFRTVREDCRKLATADIAARTQYAYVSYRENHVPQARIAAVPENAPFKVGDSVYVNRRNCTLHALDPNTPTREVFVPLWRGPEREQK